VSPLDSMLLVVAAWLAIGVAGVLALHRLGFVARIISASIPWRRSSSSSSAAWRPAYRPSPPGISAKARGRH
jgi:hypothetical protein